MCVCAVFPREDSTLTTQHSHSAAGDDRPDFNLVGVGKHFIFCDKLIAPDDEMRLNHQIEFT